MAMQTISGSDSTWWEKMNANFEELVEAPFPLKSYSDVSTLTAARNPKLYKNCVTQIDGILYRSDGTTWIPVQQLDAVTDLVPASVTFGEVKTAFNALLADLRAKHWLAT